MFSVVYSVLLQPLPYGEPDRLVNLWNTAPKRGLPRAYVGIANVVRLEGAQSRLRRHRVVRADRELQPHRRRRARAAPRLARVGESVSGPRRDAAPRPDVHRGRGRAVRGRTSTVAILTYGLWVSGASAADPAVVGRTILLSGVPYTVVGVMRADFAFPTRDYQIYTPLTFDPQELVNRMNYSYLSVARLKPGVSIEQAQAEMDVLSAQIEREHPQENDGIGADVVPMLRRHRVRRADAALRPACGGRRDAADRLRQPREPAAGARAGARGASSPCARRSAHRAARLMRPVDRRAAADARGRRCARPARARRGRSSALVPLLPADLPRVENIGLHLPVLAFTVAALGAIAVFVGVWPALEAVARRTRRRRSPISRAATRSARARARATCSSSRRSRRRCGSSSAPRC